MIIGFTGTQHGMTDFQKGAVEYLLMQYMPGRVHHGDCIGADAQFDKIAHKLKIERVVHPPSDTGKKRAHCKAEYIHIPVPALIRNRHIVDAVDLMIAAPGQDHEILRSGTWATIRYARSQGKKLWIVYPDRVRKEEAHG